MQQVMQVVINVIISNMELSMHADPLPTHTNSPQRCIAGTSLLHLQYVDPSRAPQDQAFTKVLNVGIPPALPPPKKSVQRPEKGRRRGRVRDMG